MARQFPIAQSRHLSVETVRRKVTETWANKWTIGLLVFTSSRNIQVTWLLAGFCLNKQHTFIFGILRFILKPPSFAGVSAFNNTVTTLRKSYLSQDFAQRRYWSSLFAAKGYAQSPQTRIITLLGPSSTLDAPEIAPRTWISVFSAQQSAQTPQCRTNNLVRLFFTALRFKVHRGLHKYVFLAQFHTMTLIYNAWRNQRLPMIG